MKDLFVLIHYKKLTHLISGIVSFLMISFSSVADELPLSSPAPSPIEMSGRWNQGPVFASAISDNHMYFGTAGTVRVVAVERDSTGNPVAWEEVADIATEGVVRDMLIANDLLMIADGSGWLRLIDISDPDAPKASGKLALDSEIKALDFADDRVYIAAGWKGVHIIDVTSPLEPRLINTFPSKGYSLDVVVVNNIAFVAGGHDAGLQITDLSNPLKPKALGAHDISGSASGIDSDGRFVYVVNMDDNEPSLSVFDAEDLLKPVRIAAEPLVYGAERVRLVDNFVYVAGVANDAGLIVVDVTEPSKPKKLGSWWDPTCSESVTIDKHVAYLSHGDQGLEVLDIKDPNDPKVIKHFAAAGHVRGIDTQGQLAYIANGYRGLKLVDVSNHGSPVDLSELKTYRALDVDVAGPFAHIADDWAGYKLIDVSDKNHPKLLASLDTPGYAEGIQVQGRYVYIADGEGGLRILNITDTLMPVEVASVATGGYAYDVYVLERTAYVAAGKAGLISIDISNPKAPVILDSYKFSERKFEARGIYVENDIAYLAAGYMGMLLVDAKKPAELSSVGHYMTSKRANNVSVSGGKAYLIDSDAIRVIDVTRATTPKLIAEHPLPASAARVHSDDNGIFVAGMESGLVIFEQ